MIEILTPSDESTIERVARIVADADFERVLDVGGGAKPLRAATHVIELMSYEARRVDEGRGEPPERFTAATWLQSDVNVTPWPYPDDYFDFAWCCQIVEDIRDPIGVCRELQRVARAGFISTVQRRYESSVVQDDGVIGYHHHRWLVEAYPDHNALKFTFKSPILQVDPSIRPRYDTAEWLLNVPWQRPFEAVEAYLTEGWLQRDELKRWKEAYG